MDQVGKRRAFCVFEGGGARGIAHIGSLSAVEDSEEFDIAGYAGTSAGSIIAALAAAGFDSKDMLTVPQPGQKGRSILDFIDDEHIQRPFQLFKPRHWRRLKAFRLISKWPRWLRWTAFGLVAIVVLFPLISRVLGMFLPNDVLSNKAYVTFLKAMWLVYVFGTLALLISAWRFFRGFRGIASLSLFIEEFDKLLKSKLGLIDDGPVLFKHFRDRGMHLKIVAADIKEGKMRLFSTESSDCLDIEVARAVAASSAIPLAFRAVGLDASYYCDGGLVSNLPAWTFDSDLINDRKTWVITSEIFSGGAAKESIERRPKGFRFIKEVMMTGVFGGSDLNTRGLKHHLSLPQNPNIGVMDFDADLKLVHEQFIVARLMALYRIEARVAEERTLRAIYDHIVPSISEILGSDVGIRCGLMRGVSLSGEEPAGYHMWCCYGEEEFIDDYIFVRAKDSLTEECISDQQPVTIDLLDPGDVEKFSRVSPDNSITKSVPKKRRWDMTVPLVQDPKHRGASRVSVALSVVGDVELGELKESCEKVITDAVNRLWS